MISLALENLFLALMNLLPAKCQSTHSILEGFYSSKYLHREIKFMLEMGLQPVALLSFYF